MPLTSKNAGPDLAPGDMVRMPWRIARVFTSLDAVLVERQGPQGDTAVQPARSAMRLAVRGSTLGVPLVVGAEVWLLWRVGQVFPASGAVLVTRDGLDRPHGLLQPVTLTTGALAADLEWVAPAALRAPSRPPRPFTLDPTSVQLEPDMLPYGYEPAEGAMAPEPPVAPTLAQLTPSAAVLGAPSFTLHVFGQGFKAGAVIVFAGQDEPTTLVSGAEVTTGVDMDVWLGPDTLPVYVRQAGLVSNTLSFTFTPAAVQAAAPEPMACAEP